MFEYADLVHKVIIMESEISVNGDQRNITFPSAAARFAPFEAKLVHCVLTEAEVRAALVDYHTQAARDSHVLEAMQRRAMFTCLKANGLAVGDMLLVGDLDEVPWRSTVQLLRFCAVPPLLTLQMQTYRYSYANPIVGDVKVNTGARVYDGMARNWIGHHSRLGGDLLEDAGSHCTWCFASLQQFRYKVRVWTEYRYVDVTSDEELRQRICAGASLDGRFRFSDTAGYSYVTYTAINLASHLPSMRSARCLPRILRHFPDRMRYLLPGNCTRPSMTVPHKDSILQFMPAG